MSIGKNLLILSAACGFVFVASAKNDTPDFFHIAKQWALYPVADSSVIARSPETAQLPPDNPCEAWGTWKFWNGQWWARCTFQPEASGESWSRPKQGFDNKNWTKYHGAWIKVSRNIDAAFKGKRILFSIDGIRACDLYLYVNRRYAGHIKEPAGELDISSFCTVGAQNDFHLFLAGRNHEFKLDQDPPFLAIKDPISIDDVFANTSWRQKRLTVETEITVPSGCKAKVIAEVFDQNGVRVKTCTGVYDLKKGTNLVKPFVDWPDPITWELGRGYLYTLKTKVSIGGKEYSYKDILFGFREIWRDDRKIFMNGHEQKFRVTYNFGCNKYGAKLLTMIGYNCIQYAHKVALDPQIDEETLEYLSRNGIAAIEPTTAFDWNTKVPLFKPGAARDKFISLQAKNLKRYRNWPCIAMYYMGVNCYLPQWAYEAVHLGSGDGGGEGSFARMMDVLVAEAKKTNPNVLYFSHSDGNTGEIASANLYLNWVPLQEREEWPSRWSVHGHFPFQACEFGHPYELSWFKDARDGVTEYCAIYYGEKAYELEPYRLSRNHKSGIWLGRVQHPLTREFQKDFAWRVTRAWRTFGINAGIVWFNLDTGFGMPGWPMDRVWDGYPQAVYNFYKSEEELPKGRPDWALPYWDIYSRGNKDFLGWIAGFPRITDRRHAYWPGDKIEKQCVMLWDRFDTRPFIATWEAKIGNVTIARGDIKETLKSNIPVLKKIEFTAPEVEKKTVGTITIRFRDASGQNGVDPMDAVDTLNFEVMPKKFFKWKNAATFALYDPDGETEVALKKLGIVNYKKITSLNNIGAETHLVIGSFAMPKGGFKALPMSLVEKGLRILILPQAPEGWKDFGFELQDRMSRNLFVRDRVSRAIRTLSEDDLREWSGAPRVIQKKAFGLQQYGGLTQHPKHELRWTYNMSVASLQIKTPTVAGFTPQIDGEFDLNYSALLSYSYGKGSVQFCTLDFLGRFSTGADENDEKRPISDPVIEATANAVLADFLICPNAIPATRKVYVSGAAAKRIAEMAAVEFEEANRADEKHLLLVGADSKMSASEIRSAAKNGANVLVVAASRIAKDLGLTVAPPSADPLAGVFRVKYNRKNPIFRGIGQNKLRWRDRLRYEKLSNPTDGWVVEADGLFATKSFQGGGMILISQFDPFQLEDRIKSDNTYLVDDKPQQYANKAAHDNAIRRCDISYERSHQLISQLLTNLGAKPKLEGVQYYSGLVKWFDPYEFGFW